VSARTVVEMIRQRREAGRRLEVELQRERERQVARESFERGRELARSMDEAERERLAREQVEAYDFYSRTMGVHPDQQNRNEGIRGISGTEYRARQREWERQERIDAIRAREVEEERRSRGYYRTHLRPDRWEANEISYSWTTSRTYVASSYVGPEMWPYDSPQRVQSIQAHIVAPVVQTLPENAKANDIVSLNGRIFVYDGQSWIAAIKNEKEPVTEKGRRIILEDAHADKRNSQDE
jgi:hypothetical protein